jgi:hypothetical protein
MAYKDKAYQLKQHREHQRWRYANDPVFRQEQKNRVHRNQKEQRKKLRSLINLKRTPCVICHEHEFCCISFHHYKGKKKFHISTGVTMAVPIKTMLEELTKCICLCENCHRKIHAKILKLHTVQEAQCKGYICVKQS